MWEKLLRRHKDQRKTKGRRYSRFGSRDSPSARDADHGRARPMEVHSGADIQLQPVEDPMLLQIDVPEEGCDP